MKNKIISITAILCTLLVVLSFFLIYYLYRTEIREPAVLHSRKVECAELARQVDQASTNSRRYLSKYKYDDENDMCLLYTNEIAPDEPYYNTRVIWDVYTNRQIETLISRDNEVILGDEKRFIDIEKHYFSEWN